MKRKYWKVPVETVELLTKRYSKLRNERLNSPTWTLNDKPGEEETLLKTLLATLT